MKTFQKILPWALPLLVLVFVLSGCGKDHKIHALDAPAKLVTKVTQGQNANGTSAGGLSPADFAAKCSSLLNGRIESNGTICASPVAPLATTDMNPAEAGVDQVILVNIPEGYLIISTGDAPSGTADITLNGAHFMNVGERKLSKPGRLAFYVNTKSSSSGSVAIYKCVDNNLNPVWCNMDILKGNQ